MCCQKWLINANFEQLKCLYGLLFEIQNGTEHLLDIKVKKKPGMKNNCITCTTNLIVTTIRVACDNLLVWKESKKAHMAGEKYINNILKERGLLL